MWDAVIIGGGLSGLVTGISAAERGKRVLIITKGASSLNYATGALDFGDVQRLANTPKHPYTLLSNALIQKSFTYFKRLFPEYTGKWGQATDVLTPFGEFRSASLAPRGFEASRLKSAGRVLVIAPAGLKDFFPSLIIANLQRSLPMAVVTGLPVKPERFAPWLTAGKSIQGVDYANFWDTAMGRQSLGQFFGRIEKEMKKEALSLAVVFPSLSARFCDTSTAAMQSSGSLPDCIQAEVSFPVVEMTAFPPTAAGRALATALVHKFKDLGGELLQGVEVTGADMQSGECRRILVQSKGKTIRISARHYVLASGGTFSGGIEVDNRGAAEKVFGLPLYVPDDWTRTEFLGEQPYAKVGVEVDKNLRPLRPNGQVAVNNVMVTGRMLAHWDPWLEKCGGGVSLASGYLAGGLI
ncbi:MAG TPA: anaerobic glycerol-3-phosphate dehydrogenase subunit GlpB [Desulfobacteria bacterium]|nr:anaerobic glycerol-3-phosphate dehydrogenase subunit GlpB [Desulfobacteria bacterium]